MTKGKSPHELLPLTPPVFHILLALSDEERHGYGIMQDVARQTEGALQLGSRNAVRLFEAHAGGGAGGGIGRAAGHGAG